MKEKKFHITNYVHIKNSSIFNDGQLIFQTEENEFSIFIKSAYKFLDTGYPKFFKMDSLSKLAFLASDILLKEEKTNQNIALVFSNRASSLDTDRKHQNSIESGSENYASPAVFVYTLPNICLGEISIRHKLYSENSFFIFNRFNASHLFKYSEMLLSSNKAEKVLCGWVDYDCDDYEAFVYLVSEFNVDIVHSIAEIDRIYKTQ